MKHIVTVPNPVLSTPAQPVTAFDAKLAKLIAQMTETLLATRNPKGVGLAAPQIGVSLQIFITKPNEKAAVRAFINPEIISVSAEKPKQDSKRLEGCLSIPKIWGKVNRGESLKLKFQDEKGAPHEEDFSGFIATIIQHETDHVKGVVFTQRVLEQKGKLYQVVKDKDKKEVLEEIKI